METTRLSFSLVGTILRDCDWSFRGYSRGVSRIDGYRVEWRGALPERDRPRNAVRTEHPGGDCAAVRTESQPTRALARDCCTGPAGIDRGCGEGYRPPSPWRDHAPRPDRHSNRG